MATINVLGKALSKAGITADPMIFKYAHLGPGLMMDPYKDKPEFDEGFFKIRN